MNTRGLGLVLVLTVLLGGCYTTKVYTGAMPYGAQLADRQWYTIGGLVSLSDPAGLECTAGLAKAESAFAGLDILINVGLAIAGGVVGGVACSGSNDGAPACASAGASLVPFLIASRTVRYTCAAPPLAPGAWPPRPLQAPPAPYQPPPPTGPVPAPPAPYQPPPTPPAPPPPSPPPATP